MSAVADGDYRTPPCALRDVGYQTALISPFPQIHGAWHVVDGFDEWCDTGGDGAERWLDDHATEENWYLHVNFWGPHKPYDTPQSFGNPFTAIPARNSRTERR